MSVVKYPSVNGMGVRPQENSFGRSSGIGGNTSRGKIGEVEASGVVARGEFGGTRDPEGRVKTFGGRKMKRRETGRK